MQSDEILITLHDLPSNYILTWTETRLVKNCSKDFFNSPSFKEFFFAKADRFFCQLVLAEWWFEPLMINLTFFDEKTFFMATFRGKKLWCGC